MARLRRSFSLSPWRPSGERSGRSRLATERLRRRVLASVNDQPQARAGHARPAPRRRAAWLLAAGLMLGASFALGVLLGDGLSHAGRTRARTGASKSAPAGARAVLELRSGTSAELIASGLPEPPAGEVYEVWLIRAGGATQATDALFTVSHAGQAAVDVPGDLRGVREVMVTSEPLGGSSRPMSPAVLRVALSGASG